MNRIKVIFHGFRGTVDKEAYILAKWKDLRRYIPGLERDVIADHLEAVLLKDYSKAPNTIVLVSLLQERPERWYDSDKL